MLRSFCTRGLQGRVWWPECLDVTNEFAVMLKEKVKSSSGGGGEIEVVLNCFESKNLLDVRIKATEETGKDPIKINK